MRPIPKLLTAFAVAPLATFPATLLVATVLGTIFPYDCPPGCSFLMRLRGSAGLGAYVGLIALLYAFPIMLLLGIPVTLALRRLGRFRLNTMAGAGALVGALPFLPFLLGGLTAGVRGDTEVLPFAILWLVAGTMSGLLTACVVWLMAPQPPPRPVE